MTSEKRIELHAEFYNRAYKEALDVNLRTLAQIDDDVEELEEILLKAKASRDGKITAKRERVAGLSKEERDKLISRPDLSTSDGLNVPKVRKDRMTQADKVKADFDKMVIAGMMTQEDADKIMGTVAPSESAQGTLAAKDKIKAAAKEPKPNENTFTFNSTPTPVDDEEEKVVPLNPTKITQESLLADLLSNVNMESTDIKRLTESYNTAALLVGKTVHKLQPDKMILLGSRIAELAEQREAKEKLANEVKKTDISEGSTSTTNVLKIDEGKLFG